MAGGEPADGPATTVETRFPDVLSSSPAPQSDAFGGSDFDFGGGAVAAAAPSGKAPVTDFGGLSGSSDAFGVDAFGLGDAGAGKVAAPAAPANQEASEPAFAAPVPSAAAAAAAAKAKQEAEDRERAAASAAARAAQAEAASREMAAAAAEAKARAERAEAEASAAEARASEAEAALRGAESEPVSYTHLTLPTKRIV